MKAKQYRMMRTGWLLSMLLACMLWPAGKIGAQEFNKYDVDMTKLNTAGNYIYLGHYKHATTMSEGKVTKEDKETPILWRVMGNETADTITLMSEYVLDTATFSPTACKWEDSYLYGWLNTKPGFPNSFTDMELARIKNDQVPAPAFNEPRTDINLTDIQNLTSSTKNTQFYLPWGTPVSENNKGDTAYWNIGYSQDNSTKLNTMRDNIIVGDPTTRSGAGLKDQKFMKDNNVYYWLRTLVASTNASASSYALKVSPEGNNAIDGIGARQGVRPICRLDPEEILFASELKEKSAFTQLDQLLAEDTEYKEAGKIPNNLSSVAGYACKLTVVNKAITLDFNEPTLDLDDTLDSNGSSTVYINPGDTIQIRCTTSGAFDSIVYKLVDNSIKTLARYGFTRGKDSVNLVARNLFTDEKYVTGGTYTTNEDAGPLLPNTEYTAYVWAQKNYETQSHEGSEPKYFTLKVVDDRVAPDLTNVSVVRGHEPEWGATAEVKFKIEDPLGGKYYYLLDPPTAPTTVEDFIAAGATKTAFSKVSHDVTINNFNFTNLIDPEKTNDPHDIYLLAKDSVRNTSAVRHIEIPPYVPNEKPVASDYTLSLEEGQDTILYAKNFTTDKVTPPDLEEWLIIAELDKSDLNEDVAQATLNTADGTLRIIAGIPGSTTIEVVVDDQTDILPQPPINNTDTAIITIAVREATPDAKINCLTEELTNLRPGDYLMGGDTVVISADTTTYPIAEKWFGTTLPIIRTQLGKPSAVNSIAQMLPIPRRPAAPELTPTNESFINYKDGQIYGVSTEMEYKLDTMNWVPVPNRRILENLAPGVYQVRMRVTDSTFVGDIARITIHEGVSAPAIMRAVYMPEVAGITTNPAAGVTYIYSTRDFDFAVKFSNKVTPVRTSRIINGVQEVLSGVINVEGGYTYTIRNVQERVAIYLDPDVGTVEVEAEEQSAVWSTSGQVYVRTDREDTAVIYGLTGRIVKRAELSEGTTAIPLRAGLYVVTLQKSGIRRKVLIQ